MNESRHKVKTYQIKAHCDVCGGDLLPTSVMLMSNPPKFPHKCNWCNREEVLNDKYPKLVYKYVEVEE